MATAIKTEPMIGVVEAASRLGVSRGTIYNWIHDGLIPGARQVAAGKAWRIPEASITNLL